MQNMKNKQDNLYYDALWNAISGSVMERDGTVPRFKNGKNRALQCQMGSALV